LGFGRVVAEPPTPRAITLKPTEEDIKNAARIFFMVFYWVKVYESEQAELPCQCFIPVKTGLFCTKRGGGREVIR